MLSVLDAPACHVYIVRAVDVASDEVTKSMHLLANTSADLAAPTLLELNFYGIRHVLLYPSSKPD